MNVKFTKKQEMYIEELVASGEYKNKSEVVRDALRLHRIYREKLVKDLLEDLNQNQR